MLPPFVAIALIHRSGIASAPPGAMPIAASAAAPARSASSRKSRRLCKVHPAQSSPDALGSKSVIAKLQSMRSS
jgi:hypothetical protein